MSLVDDIKRDREAGTPGPWAVMDGINPRFLEVAGCHLAHFSRDEDGPKHRDANTLRIARVPDLEAAYLALVEENARIKAAAEETIAACDEFERRCAAGEVRSKRSRAAFANASTKLREALQ